jgi:hypothetical protein
MDDCAGLTDVVVRASCLYGMLARRGDGTVSAKG